MGISYKLGATPRCEAMMQSRWGVAPTKALSIAMVRYFVTTFCLFFALACRSDENRYKVTYVYDGDTVKLRPIHANNAKNDVKLRIKDIDAPERNQDFGLKSRRALIELCVGKNIVANAQITGLDKYHRALGKLQCNNTDASLYLAERGLAWHYTQYSHDVVIDKAAKNARKQTLGLWVNNNPTPPWVWRRLHSNQPWNQPHKLP